MRQKLSKDLERRAVAVCVGNSLHTHGCIGDLIREGEESFRGHLKAELAFGIDGGVYFWEAF